MENISVPISVVTEILGCHARTLRIYDTEGLLKPSRSPKNRRKYSMNDIEKGKFIQYLSRELGINIIGIKIIFEFLKAINIKPENYKYCVSDLTRKIGITPEMQAENKEKLSRRGRKPRNV